MADVQLEHGFTRLANRLLTAMALAPWDSASQPAVLLGLIRVTYGARRKEAPVGLSDWRNLTGLPDSTIKRALGTLERNKVIVCTRKADPKRCEPKTWAVQKDFTRWKRYSVNVENVEVAESVVGERLSAPPRPPTTPGSRMNPGSPTTPGSPVTPDPGSPMDPGPGSPMDGGSGSEPNDGATFSGSKERERKRKKEPPRTPPTARRGVENSNGPTSGDLALEANRVLGMGTWFGDQGELHERFTETKQLIWRNWLGRGVSADRVQEAIRGLRLLVDEGRPEWLADRKRKPLDGLSVLVNTKAVVPVGDGDSCISLFAAAVQRYTKEQGSDGGQPGDEGVEEESQAEMAELWAWWEDQDEETRQQIETEAERKAGDVPKELHRAILIGVIQDHRNSEAGAAA